VTADPFPPPSQRTRGRWDALPGDQPDLTRWLAGMREEQAGYEPLPPPPDGER
jgi:hypothetical protein